MPDEGGRKNQLNQTAAGNSGGGFFVLPVGTSSGESEMRTTAE
jgi:hypothetical protein